MFLDWADDILYSIGPSIDYLLLELPTYAVYPNLLNL